MDATRFVVARNTLNRAYENEFSPEEHEDTHVETHEECHRIRPNRHSDDLALRKRSGAAAHHWHLAGWRNLRDRRPGKLEQQAPSLQPRLRHARFAKSR